MHATKDAHVNICKIICDDGWFVKAPTYAEAHSLVIKMLIENVGEIDEVEAQALFEHDTDRGIIQIIHRTKGTHREH
jgi:hypothetical protein